MSKLTNLDALLGGEVDERAREIEACARQGRPLPTAAELEERTRQALREAWRSSRNRRAFEARPNRTTMLRSFYLDGGSPSEEEIARVQEKLPVCMERLLDVPHWQRLRECGSEGCVPIPDFAHFFLDGIKVFAAADLAYVHDDMLFTVDWKSGRIGNDDSLQVLLQVFGLRESDDTLALLPVSASLHYLTAGDARMVSIPEELEEHVRDVVMSGVKAMRARLYDPELNVPLEMDEFERRESRLCRYCNFTPLCEQAY